MLGFPLTNKKKKPEYPEQLLRDFQQFSRRMRLQYPTIQKRNEILSMLNQTGTHQCNQSVARGTYLEEAKISSAEINLTKHKNNLSPAERDTLKALKGDEQINVRKPKKSKRRTNSA